MVKTVVTGREVPHLFAARTQETAKNSCGSLWFTGGTLYSYRLSFPLARFHGTRVLINADRASVTTSKHQAWARFALRHVESVSLPDLHAVCYIIDRKSEIAAAEYIAARAKDIAALENKRPRADWKIRERDSEIAALKEACRYVWQDILGKRSDWTRAIGIKEKSDKAAKIARYTASRNRLESGMETARRMIETARHMMRADIESGRTHGLQAWWRLDNAAADICRIDEMGARRGLGIGATATFADAAKIMGKKWAQECMALANGLAEFADSLRPEIAALRVEYDKQEALQDAERLAAWLDGTSNTAPRGTIVCRVINGDTVETSKGARVPLPVAIDLAGLAKACRESGKGLDLAGRKIGAYRGDKITADGTLVVGCHSIPWDSIADAMARAGV